MADEIQVLDFWRANFARLHERLDGIDNRLRELTTRVSAIGRDLAAIGIERIERRLSLIEG